MRCIGYRSVPGGVLFSFRRPRLCFLFRLLCISACLTTSLSAWSQTFTDSAKNVEVEHVLNMIQQKGYIRFYTGPPALLKLHVSYNVKDASAEAFLNVILKGLPLTFNIEGNVITLRQKEIAFKAPESPTSMRVYGKVTDGSGHPLPQTSIEIKRTRRGTVTDSNGRYELDEVGFHSLLHFSRVSMQTVEMRVKEGSPEINIRMDSSEEELSTAVNTGYQKIIPGRATGSVNLISNLLFNRTVSSNWTDRLENLTPGLLYNHGGQGANGASIPDPILIHGRSTINASAAPLIVVDNFPYDGDPANINPNDILNVSILKDAAATAIWGARAGNGVIVITTKKGRRLAPKIVVDNNISLTQRPDLRNIRSITSPDFIEYEKKLYGAGYYSPGPSGFAPVTPVIALLQGVFAGKISLTDANAEIEALKRYNVLNDLQRYFYRNSIIHRHYIEVSGGSNYNRYFFSGGWDQGPTNLAGNQNNRYTLRMQNEYVPNSRLELDAGVNLAGSFQQNGNNPGYLLLKTGGKSLYPYAQLATAQGNPLPVNLYYPLPFLQQATRMGFMDWSYSPLGDIAAEKNSLSTHDILANIGFRYSPFPSLNLEVKYQFESQTVVQNDLHSDSSWYTRNLINSFSQPAAGSSHPLLPIPVGGILDRSDQELISHQLRVQANYHHFFGDWHELSALGGYEIKSLVNTGVSSRYYGYDPDTRSWNPNIDYTTSYPLYPSGTETIPTAPPMTGTTDHFISYFSNATYTFDKKYILSGSAREDATNLFGARTNRRGVPLWSVGSAWNISNEDFFPRDWLSFLKLRATYGISGNVSRLVSAYTTAVYSVGGLSGTPYTIANIQNPANENLRWEQVKTLNFAIDFTTHDTVLSGTFEYYHKNADALLTQMAADPTLGLIRNPGAGNFYYGNSAAMEGKGADLQIEARLLRGKFQWTVNGIYSYSTSVITSLTASVAPGHTYLNANGINAVKGRPVFGVYSYVWKGLDGNGNPVGMLNGMTSTQWDSIYTYTPLSDMKYNGPSQPTSFGALRNSFAWKRIGLSFNISYKFGYYFRKPSVSYSDLADHWNSSGDYALRWQSAGNEKKTHVPSAPTNYLTAAMRDNFYLNSSVLVAKADNIRLEDVRLEYGLNRSLLPKLPFANVLLYATVTNVALLWKANKDGIDPYYINTPRDGRRWSFGATIDL